MFKSLVLKEFLDLNLAVSLCVEFFNHGLLEGVCDFIVNHPC